MKSLRIQCENWTGLIRNPNKEQVIVDTSKNEQKGKQESTKDQTRMNTGKNDNNEQESKQTKMT